MGNSGSKAAQSSLRKFPTKPTRVVPPAPRPARPTARPSASRDKDVLTDATRPEQPDAANTAFSDRLRQMGVVQPNPTYSPSSTASRGPSPLRSADVMDSAPPAPTYPSAKSNATLGVLEARRQLQERADAEFDNMGKSTDRGREFLDIATIRDMLALRERGVRPADIETRLRLKPGAVQRLGPPGVVSVVRP